MPHSFNIVSESAASVKEIHAAFRRENYWLDRLAGDAASTLDWFNGGAEGVVEVHITQHLGRQILPPLVAKLTQKSAIMYFAFFAVGFLTATVVMVGGGKGSRPSSSGASGKR
jgi:hypothetical protein